MRILVTGSSGFIGRNLVDALLRDGHMIVCAVRRLPKEKPPSDVPGMPALQYVQADFMCDLKPEDWMPRLQGIDAVVNAVGIIREHGAQTFDALHVKAPCALFAACAAVGVRRIVQISALGADERAESAYHLSKKAADDFLVAQRLPAVILQPSLVYGPGGASAALFDTLATLPVLARFGDGRQMVQPVHIEDVVDAVRAGLDAALCAALHDEASSGIQAHRIAVVGPKAMTLNDFLRVLRAAMRLRPAFVVPVPMAVVRMAAHVAGMSRRSTLDRDTFRMLERGNTGDPAKMVQLIGRSPRHVERFIDAADAETVRKEAELRWLMPVLRAGIAIVWIVTGLLSFGIYPVEDSLSLLARSGVPVELRPAMLYGAAALDIVIGIGILLVRKRWIWAVQIALILFYTAIIAWRLPEFLLHPYGPVLKNLPMLAAIWLLMKREER